jgi:sulfate permease, SulP family
MAAASAASAASPPRIELDRRELAGAVADIGVLIPIATALIVSNRLSATAVLLPAGLLYLVAALVYRLPVPVQPLKAFGAIAIAKGLGSDEIAAGALLMGVIFIVLGRTGLLDLAARACPRALIRGVQLTVGLLFLKIAWELVHHPPGSFAAHALGPELAVPLAFGVAALALALRRKLVSLPLAAAGLGIAVAQAGGELSFGPSALALPSLDGEVIWTAFTLLVIPQVPLTFANSCIATADAARTYFGDAGERVRPGRLAATLGLANLFSGSVSGMPVCHGAGGMTAHQAFGARTGGAPLAMGSLLLLLALTAGAGLAAVLAAFPLPILAGMLAVAGLLHIGLLRDLSGARDWAIALLVGLVGFQVNLALGLALGLVLWWLPAALRAWFAPRALAQSRH